MGKLDLHIHTTASDGTLEPEEIVEWAVRRGLSGISITDHDTVSGIERCIKHAEKYEDFVIIPGIELSCDFDNTEVHILGYYINYKSREIVDLMEKLSRHRLNRGKKMVENLRRHGLDITFKEVQRVAGDGVIGRPHIAKVLEDKGYVNNMDEAFEKYIGNECFAYVKRYKLSVKEAINLIHNIGGTSVLAHPGMIGNDNIVRLIINEGIDGIETIHPKHSQNDRIKYEEIANKNELIETGGSDFHGCNKNGKYTIKNCYVDSSVINKLRNKSSKIYRSETYGSKQR